MFSCFGMEGSSRGRRAAPKRSFMPFGLGTSTGQSVPMQEERLMHESEYRWLMNNRRSQGPAYAFSPEPSDDGTEEDTTIFVSINRALWEERRPSEAPSRAQLQMPEPEDLTVSSVFTQLTELQLAILPSWQTTEKEARRTCSVCLDAYQLKSLARTLPCFHFFHQDCIDTWLLAGKNTCPVCKKRVSSGIQENLL